MLAHDSNYRPIIPRPCVLEDRPGAFSLGPDSEVVYDAVEAQIPAIRLRDYLRPATGYDLKIRSGSPALRSVFLTLDSSFVEVGPEGYELTVGDNSLVIRSRSAAGLFYGVQTLRWLLPVTVMSPDKKKGPWVIRGVHILDEPRFAWRGLMLDEGRHWFGKDYVKRFLDLMAFHKLNVFHWHLTENAGWRIDIRRYPLLRTVAAWRRETVIGHMNQPGEPRYDGTPYGGCYTQEDIREIVAYATERFIQVVPEIEMPAHCQAALAAYPELGCTGGPYEVMCRWGHSHEVFCAGNDATFTFLENVLDEVCDLFPSPFIHIGGDECIKDAWNNCPKCQRLMRDKGLLNSGSLQSYFIRRIERHLRANGRHIVGWDEILEGGELDPAAVLMVWLEKFSSLENAARLGNPVVATLHRYTYFDYYQGDPAKEPLAIGGNLPLSKVYGFDPVPADASAQQRKSVIGMQGQIWSQYIKTIRHLEYMTFPRTAALAEGAWSPAKVKNYDNFFASLPSYFDRLEQLGVNYRRPEPPGHEWREDTHNGQPSPP